MKSLKWTILGMLVVALALPVNAADIGLTKDVNPSNPNIYHRGDTIHYVMTVENLHGSETIEVDLVEDTLPDGTVVVLASGSPAFSLGPGGVQNFVQDFVVPNSALGIIVNELRVVGTQLSTVPDEFDARVTKSSLVIVPCVDVTKTADPTVSKEGHEIVYTIEVCNCSENGDDLGNLQLVSVIDSLLGDLTGAFSPVLPLGQCETRQFPRTVLEGDPDPLSNEVTVNYTDITGFQVTDADIAEVDLVDPDFTVTKVCQNGPVPFGDDAEFEIIITNTGDVGLDFTTDDPAIPPFSLPPGGVLSQLVTRPVPSPGEDVCNTIEVTATLPPDLNLDNVITKTASDCCPTLPPEPCIEITKEVDCGISKEGDDVIYTICITNCGPTPLQITSVIDTLLGDLTMAAISACGEDVIGPGQQCCFDVPLTVPAGPDPLINEVIVTAVDPFGQAIQAGPAIVEVDLIHPSMTVTKTCQTPGVSPGGDADFLITITNTGDVDLEISTNDAEIPPFTLTTGDPVYTKTVTRTDPGGVEEVCNEIEVTWTLDPANCNLDNTETITSGDCCPIIGEAGCTPGFWKNNAVNKGANAWCDTYDPDDDFSDTFGIPEQELRDKGKDVFSDPTLLEALNANGGGINALARHATAALLNACSDCVDYPMSAAGIIAAVQDAIADGEDAIQALHIQLAEFNEAGCPINQQGECSNGTDG